MSAFILALLPTPPFLPVPAAFSTNLTRHSYQFQLVILYAIPIWLMIYSATYMPESPRWLATQGREEEAARSLRKIRGSHYAEAHIEVELQNIKQAILAEKEAQVGASFFDIFRSAFPFFFSLEALLTCPPPRRRGTDLRRTLLYVYSNRSAEIC